MNGRVRDVLLVTALGTMTAFGTACSDSDDDDRDEPMVNGNGIEQSLDPNGLLGSLEFASAENDARYRCLLDRLDAQAQTAGLEEFSPLDDRGDVVKSWCSAAGEDANQCMRGLVLGLRDRGSEGSAVWAYRERTDATVQEYGYRVGHNPPADAASTWALDFDRTRGFHDRFSARFVSFEDAGRNYDRDLVVSEPATLQVEGQDVDDLVAAVEWKGSPAELLATLGESSARFAQVLDARYDRLLAEYERLLALRGNIAESTRTRARESAREVIGAQRAVVTDNAEAMHSLLRDAVIGEDCG